MKKDRYYSLGIFLAFNVVLFNTATHANSSWYWISETRPFDILPWVAIATIIIETLSINYVGRIYHTSEISFVLRKDAGIHCTKRLLTSIVFSNLVTTIMVAVVERIICQGSW